MGKLLGNGLERKSVDIKPELLDKIRIEAVKNKTTAKELMEKWITEKASKIK